LFVPGAGGGGLETAINALLSFLSQRAKTARYVTSVCTGGLLLAAAGLLDGYKGTSHWAVVDCLRLFPKVESGFKQAVCEAVRERIDVSA
jgi:cyclohexyl-isocyanide hydratase